MSDKLNEQLQFKKSILVNLFKDTKTKPKSSIQYTDSNKNNGLILLSKFHREQKKIWFTIYERHLSFIKETEKSFIVLSCYTNRRVFKLNNDFFDIFLDKLIREDSNGIRVDITVFFKDNQAILDIPKADNIDISKYEVFLNNLETQNFTPKEYTLKETGSFIYNIPESTEPITEIIEHIKQIETSLQQLKKQVEILQSKK